MKILIVGGAGYVGGVVTDLLIKNKYNVTVYDSLLYEDQYMKDCPFILGDVRDESKLKGLLSKFDTVVWIAALVGTLTLVVYALVRGGQEGGSLTSNVYLVGAVISAAIGYAEGAILAKEMPGWQVDSWCVVLTLPLTMPGFLISLWLGRDSHSVSTVSLLAFLFTAFGSMYFGFFAWYRGLSELGVAKGSQVQLIQPLLTLLWSAILLNEVVTGATMLAASVVILCISVVQRLRVTMAKKLVL